MGLPHPKSPGCQWTAGTSGMRHVVCTRQLCECSEEMTRHLWTTMDAELPFFPSRFRRHLPRKSIRTFRSKVVLTGYIFDLTLWLAPLVIF